MIGSVMALNEDEAPEQLELSSGAAQDEESSAQNDVSIADSPPAAIRIQQVLQRALGWRNGMRS